MPYLWELWANPQHQQEPEGDWQIWVIMGGRGAGKTRAGAEWVRAQVEGATPRAPGRCRRVCLLGETIDQTRAVMVEGDSGILAVSPPDRRPELKISQSKLVWPNGAEAMLASAANPEALRGPQFDCAWSDELAKWRYCREAWDMLQFCLRLGDRTRQLVTTTPRNNEVLLEILESPFTAVTRAPTSANLANLAPDFLARLEERYGGTSLGRQELEGELIRDAEGALWTRELVETARIDAVPELDRVVVAVDPPVTGNAASDECGIVVAGCAPSPEGRLHAYVLADYSIAGGPTAWAEMALEAYREHRADRLVAEVNQGGELIETVIREIDPDVSYRAVRATQGKRVRAEPVAALYEQGRVHHLAGLAALEDQMCRFTAKGVGGIKSPDRLDALVWALTDLVLDRPRAPRPGVRTL
ncbi:MAG: terminase family protein [Pseudomonadota bacterium]